MKIYITSGIEGVQNLPEDHVECVFEESTVDLKINGLPTKKGPQNFRLRAILGGKVTPDACKYSVGENRISVTLKKADETATWDDLVYVEKLPEEQEEQKTGD